MKRRIKKMVTVGLAMAMMVAVTVNVAAAPRIGIAYDSDTISLNGGYAECYVECDNDYAYASTDVTVDYTADSTWAYVEVSFDILINNVSYEYVGSDSDSSSGSASCSVSTDASYSLAGSASSYHEAEIGDDKGSSSLSAEN